MKNITRFSLDELQKIKKFQDLALKDEAIQRLSYYLQRESANLKKELDYPLFWKNYQLYLEASIKKSALVETSLNMAQKKISLYSKLDESLLEVELLTPQEIVRLLSFENINPKHRQVLEILVSYAPVFLSFNLILNLE